MTQTKSHHERLLIAKTFIDENKEIMGSRYLTEDENSRPFGVEILDNKGKVVLTIHSKTFRQFYTPEDFFQVCNEMLTNI